MAERAGHRAGPARVTARVVTVSDRCSRGEMADESGPAARAELERAGVLVRDVVVVPDEAEAIRSAVLAGDVDVVLLTGGTGVGPRDVTVETVRPLFEKELPGFGELFRARSAGEVGPAAILSRATAGVVAGTVVVCAPGSPRGARLAASLIAPELGHLVGHVRGC